MKTLTLRAEAPARVRNSSLRCETPGCGAVPSGGKPRCERCVESMPYAALLVSEHERREADLRHAARGRVETIDVAGSRCREILGILLMGEKTVGSLVHEVDVTGGRYGAPSLGIVRAFCQALERAGLVHFRVLRDRQGRTRETVRLAP